MRSRLKTRSALCHAMFSQHLIEQPACGYALPPCIFFFAPADLFQPVILKQSHIILLLKEHLPCRGILRVPVKPIDFDHKFFRSFSESSARFSRYGLRSLVRKIDCSLRHASTFA